MASLERRLRLGLCPKLKMLLALSSERASLIVELLEPNKNLKRPGGNRDDRYCQEIRRKGSVHCKLQLSFRASGSTDTSEAAQPVRKSAIF